MLSVVPRVNTISSALSCANEIGHALPRSFVMFGRARAQRVQTAMHIGVFVLVIIADRVEHGSRLLRSGRVVEVNQRMTIHVLAQESGNPREAPTQSTLTSGGSVHEIICAKRRFAAIDSSNHAKIDIHAGNVLRLVLKRSLVRASPHEKNRHCLLVAAGKAGARPVLRDRPNPSQGIWGT